MTLSPWIERTTPSDDRVVGARLHMLKFRLLVHSAAPEFERLSILRGVGLSEDAAESDLRQRALTFVLDELTLPDLDQYLVDVQRDFLREVRAKNERNEACRACLFLTCTWWARALQHRDEGRPPLPRVHSALRREDR